MSYPDSVLTKGKKDKLEIRALDSRGQYVMCAYLDPKTMKPADQKRKLILKSADGHLTEFFIIPLSDSKRSLLVKSEPEEKEIQLWNAKSSKAEEIWDH